MGRGNSRKWGGGGGGPKVIPHSVRECTVGTWVGAAVGRGERGGGRPKGIPHSAPAAGRPPASRVRRAPCQSAFRPQHSPARAAGTPAPAPESPCARNVAPLITGHRALCWQVVASLVPSSPADACGAIAPGDALLAIDGAPVPPPPPVPSPARALPRTHACTDAHTPARTHACTDGRGALCADARRARLPRSPPPIFMRRSTACSSRRSAPCSSASRGPRRPPAPPRPAPPRPAPRTAQSAQRRGDAAPEEAAPEEAEPEEAEPRSARARGRSCS